MSLLAFDLPLFPEQASEQAWQVDAIFISLTVLCTLLVLAILAAITYCLIRYRETSDADRRLSLKGQSLLEITWAGIPMLIFMGVFAWGGVVFIHARTPPRDALTVYVVGLQWYWDIRHENGPHEVGELHVPLGQPVRLVMTSQDVIHDFAVPAFRTKMDVVPGKYTIEWFKPVKEGRYQIFCDQFCGTKHAQMVGWVDVMPPQQYGAWLAQAPAETASESGARLFRTLNCSGCHGDGAQVAAPSLRALYGRRVALEDGGSVFADDQYLRDSILNPSAQVVAGFRPLMPSYKGLVTEPQVMALIAYIKGLDSTPLPGSSATPPPTSMQP